MCWGTSNIASGTYISYFDTTSWPTGTYQVTAYVEDSNGRVTASAPISVSLPKTIRINLIQLATSNGTSSYKANLLGVSSVEGGTLSLYSSDQKDGTYTKNVDFLLGVNGLTVQATIAPGTWVKAELSGSETIKDVESSPLQVLGQLKAACVFPASGGVGSRFSGKCTFNYSLTNTPVLLQTNIGSGWGTVANGSISGNVLTPSVTPKKSGKLQVRLISPGQSGLYSSFISNVSIIQISASKKH